MERLIVKKKTTMLFSLSIVCSFFKLSHLPRLSFFLFVERFSRAYTGNGHKILLRFCYGELQVAPGRSF